MGSVSQHFILMQTLAVMLTSAHTIRTIRELNSIGLSSSVDKNSFTNSKSGSNFLHEAATLPKGRFTLRAFPQMALTEDVEIFEKENSTRGNMFEAVDFMRKFGYIPAGDNTAEFIFTAETLTEKLKLVQKFGAIPQTGELDQATLKLMASPRCGVRDVDPQWGNRIKRYIIGSKGWNKRNLTYTVANWSPKLMSKENTQLELRRAFDHWSQYSYLVFTEIESNEADIIIFFAEYNHYDNYPFDGQGGILAHAYYPYEFGSYGGDIHFDESEEWKFRPEDEHSGLDFFTVAVHEIGHSLGLAHSTVQSSIMFPYYKGMEKSFVMAYDDIMGMWDLYIRRKLEGDDEFFKTKTSETSTTTTTTPATTTTTPSNNATQNDEGEDNIRYYGDYETVDEHEKRKKGHRDELPPLPPLFPDDDYLERERKWREEEEKRREEEEKRREEEEKRRKEEKRRRWEEEKREEEKRRREEERRWEEERRRREWEGTTTTIGPSTDDVIDDICDGNFDSVAFLRNELFIFKGKNMWRYKRRGNLLYGYPALIRSMFGELPNWIQKIDAAYERRNDSRIVFFTGKYFYVYDGVQLVEGSPRPITDYGLPEAITTLDAVFFWPKNNKTYLFSRNLYWRRSDFTDKMDVNYPRGMERWHGIPKNLDAVVTDIEGVSYFFKNNEVWQYDNIKIRPTVQSPKDLRGWTGC